MRFLSFVSVSTLIALSTSVSAGTTKHHGGRKHPTVKATTFEAQSELAHGEGSTEQYIPSEGEILSLRQKICDEHKLCGKGHNKRSPATDKYP